MNILKTIIGGVRAEVSDLLLRLRAPRIWKFVAALSALLIIVGFLELIFSRTSTPSAVRSTVFSSKLTQEVTRRLKEAERLVISTRDQLARDKALIGAVRSKDQKRITREVFTKDSLLRSSHTDSKNLNYRSDFLAVAVYDTAMRIVGWNSGATYITDVEPVFVPQFDVSKRVKGVFFEETPTKQYLTAFHKLFDDNDLYVGTIVIKFFLCNEELTVSALHDDSHDDLFSDFEKKENVIVRLATKRTTHPVGDDIFVQQLVSLDEGGPNSSLHISVSEPLLGVEYSRKWDSVSALRDLMVIILVSTIFMILIFIHVRRALTHLSVRAIVRQTGAILLYTSLFRYVLYFIGAGRSLIPSSLTQQTDYAYQSMPMISDPLELIISSIVFALLFITLFLFYTSKEVKSITIPKHFLLGIVPMTMVFVILLTASALFVGWYDQIITANCSFDLSGVLEPLSATKYLLPLLSLLVVTSSVVILCVGLCILHISVLQASGKTKGVTQAAVILTVSIAIVLQMIFGGALFDVSVYVLLLAGILSFISTIRLRFTPQGYELTRSPIVAFTLVSLTCFILAPAIKRTNLQQQQQNLEQSILAKAGFQFSTAALQLPESLFSPQSLFADDTIRNRVQIPMLLLREHERLRQEIPEVNITLTVSNEKDSLMYSVGESIGNATDTDNQVVKRIPFVVMATEGDSIHTSKYVLTASLTNDLLAIGIEGDNSVVLLYTNGKLERSSETKLNIPPTLIQGVKADAGKGTWMESEIDGKKVLLFVKSIYSINAKVSEKILIGGIVGYSFGDIVIFALRYNTLGLALAALSILLALALTNKISIARFTLRFRERIFLIIFVIALVPLIFVSNITRTILQSRESEDQRRELVTESYKIANVVRPLVSEKGNLDRIPILLQDLSRTFEHRIDVFDGRGLLLASSVPELYDAFILPRLLPIVIVKSAVIDERTASYQESSNEHERITTSYLSVYDASFTTLLGIVGITRIDALSVSENEIAATSSLIYGTFSLVALLLLILGSYVSYRVASPLHDMITATEKVARGEFGTQVSFNRKDEIGDLAAAFNAMTAELDASRGRVAQSEREGAWKEMARQVAHEIKNPLTPMKLSVQHVQHAHEVKDTNFSAVFTRVMKTLSEQIDVLTRIASEFSRFGEMPRRRYGFVSLKKVVESALALFDSERAHIRFVTDVPDTISSIYADEEEFRRTLVNLLRNAVQAMDGWGVIVIAASESAGIIYLSIKDTGAGMSEETLKKAFDPNFSTKTSGMGLGLAIVKRTITDMSGTIRVESEIGKGTTFHIDLPAREV